MAISRLTFTPWANAPADGGRADRALVDDALKKGGDRLTAIQAKINEIVGVLNSGTVPTTGTTGGSGGVTVTESNGVLTFHTNDA